ncbi:MAG TPA: sigma-70 family RNA polymerase sigma factor, partial [Pyrinomonadaceae bacterium]|nr:sigma-70 family RNA polymerase sigma factor [Pyrinomonadaceae bacterium]
MQPVKIAAAAEQHEEIFLARYGRLLAWSLQLTSNDREQAEDLVQDAFIQFTFTRPDLSGIHNLEGYLYAMLRNLHLSQVRRRQRLPERALETVNYDSAELSLRATDPRTHIRVQDELRQICRYACLRKETSKAGSVLLLRFLLGYYPREIAAVARGTRQAVEERLRVARGEAKLFLENPSALHFLRQPETTAPAAVQTGYAQTTEDLLGDLRRAVFASRRGDCLTNDALKNLYRLEQCVDVQAVDAQAIGVQTLAHVSSCPRCLDAVNRLLGLPLLSERSATDTLGTDTRPRDGGDSGGGGTTTGAGGDEGVLVRCRKRARDAFEHRPQELSISVNGYVMAAQKVGARLSEQALNINIGERIEFVEVVSEQEVRLLFLSVDEPPPNGAYQRSARVALSDERTLEATLSFSNPWPTLQVVYHDPLHGADTLAQPNLLAEERAASENAPATEAQPAQPRAADATTRPRLLSWLLFARAKLWRLIAHPGFALRPGTLTAGVAIILVAALIFVRLHPPVVSAAEILHRSIESEQAAAADVNAATHRTIILEERRAGSRDVVSRRRVEVWQSAARGAKVRRVYDEQNALDAGEWERADDAGTTVYRRGGRTQTQAAPDAAPKALLEAGDVWRVDLSARDFDALVANAPNVTLEETPGSYVVRYEAQANAAAPRLVRAALTINKADLRAIEETLTVERAASDTREYRLIETGLAKHRADTVAPEVFQPDAEFSGDAGTRQGAGASAATGVALPSANVAEVAPTAVASVELEIEVNYLLDQIKANLGEQLTVERTAAGALRVEALVETARRKEEILRALSPVMNNPAVAVNVSTVEEAVARRKSQAGAGGGETSSDVEVTNSRTPADAELRRYFSARLTESARVEQEINRFASRSMSHSRQALLHASALQRLVKRLSPEEARALSADARAKWLSMIRAHAEGYVREAGALGRELSLVFPASSGAEKVDEGNPTQAAARLVQMSYAQDAAVRSAFTVSAAGASA